MMPILIRRSDSGYHSLDTTGNTISASAIRNALQRSLDVDRFIPDGCLEPFKEYLKRPIPEDSWLTPFIASRIIYDRNLPLEISDLHNVMDMTPELLNRLRKAPLPIKYIELQDYLKTKNLTMSRVSRVMLHTVLGIINEDRTMASENGYGDYLNLLAMKLTASSIPKEISQKSELTVITKKSAYKPETDCAKRMWMLDKLATDLYNQILYQNARIRLRSELTSTVRTVKD